MKCQIGSFAGPRVVVEIPRPQNLCPRKYLGSPSHDPKDFAVHVCFVKSRDVHSGLGAHFIEKNGIWRAQLIVQDTTKAVSLAWKGTFINDVVSRGGERRPW